MKKIYTTLLNYLEKKIDSSIEKYQKIKKEMHSTSAFPETKDV